VLRRRLFRGLFRHAGKGTVFGSDLTLRHVDRRNCVIVNRRASIQAKVGHIEICRDCNIGAGVQIISQGPIVIEENVSVAALSIIARGRYVVE
jgi:acetyltransferase-like isoleucine patch superfamily enzyme